MAKKVKSCGIDRTGTADVQTLEQEGKPDTGGDRESGAEFGTGEESETIEPYCLVAGAGESLTDKRYHAMQDMVGAID